MLDPDTSRPSGSLEPEPPSSPAHGGNDDSLPAELIEQSPDGVFVLRDRAVLYHNRTLETLTGYTGFELRSRIPHDLSIPADTSTVLSLISPSASEAGGSAEIRLRRKDGVRLHTELRASTIEWHGEPATLGVVTDISHRKQRSHSEDRVQRLFTLAATRARTAVILFDSAGLTVLAANPAALALRGVEEDVVGMTIEQYLNPCRFFHADGRPMAHADFPLIRAVRQRESLEPEEIVALHASGERHRLRIEVHIVPSEPDLPGSALLTAEDISDRAELLQRQAQLREEVARLRDEIDRAKADADAAREQRELVRRNHERFLDFSPFGYLVVSPSGMVQEANNTALAVLGCKRDHLVHRSLLGFAAPRHRTTLADHLSQAAASANPVSCEIELASGGAGDRRFVRVESVVDRAEHGDTHVRVILLDISKRMRAEIKLANNEQRYRSIVESPLSIILVIDGQHRLSFVSQGFCTLLGYPYRELIGVDFRPLVAQRQRETIADRYARRRRGETVPSQYEIELIGKDGKPRWIIANISLFNTAENQLQTVVHAVDVTDRERATAGLRQRESLMQQLFAQSADAVYIRRDERFLLVNPRFVELFGYSRDELLADGFDAHSLLTEKDRERFDDRLAAAIRDKEKHPILDFTGRHRDGHRLELQGTSSVIEWDGSPALLGVVRDLTQQRRMERRISQMQRLDSIGRLAGGIAHDFNNMLTGIVGQAERVRLKHDPDHWVHQEMTALLDAAYSAGELTQRLLRFSRTGENDPQHLDLNAQLQRLARMLARIVGDEVHLDLDLEESLVPVVVDPTQLEQIVVNLAINARDAMPDGGTIHISSRMIEVSESSLDLESDLSPGRYVCLSMADTGMGMTAEVLAHLFEPFFTTKEEGKGTGLGLATVYGAVRQNHGTIRVASEPGAGARFDIYLPTETVSTETPSA